MLMRKKWPGVTFFGSAMLQHRSFIMPKNDHRFMGSSLCNEFVSEVYTVPNVSGPMSGFTVSPKGPRELFFAINVNIKVSEVLLK